MLVKEELADEVLAMRVVELRSVDRDVDKVELGAVPVVVVRLARARVHDKQQATVTSYPYRL